jgi:hypothetical protein
VATHDVIGAESVAVDATTPGDHDPVLVQHGKGTVHRLVAHRGMYSRAASQQDSLAP